MTSAEKDELLISLKHFFKMESTGGILLCIAAVLAILCANSPLQNLYHTFLETKLTVTFGEIGLSKALVFWINDGLMAVFFLLVGLEIKREVLEGELSSISQALLPAVAATGGVLFPALIYTYFNHGDAVAMRGWAIPSATDIAFSLGVLALLAGRIPISLKIFLMAVAVIDDLLAIIIIAIFYTSELSTVSISIAAAGVACLYVLNRLKVNSLSPYLIVGFIIWFAVLKSGVHATIAGVVLGLFIPLKVKGRDNEPLLTSLEHELHPWVTYIILPLFAFANAGISLTGITFATLLKPIPLGIAAGLFFGKQIGIFLFSWVMFRLRLASLPEGATMLQFYAVCLIAGIGFTMSLFIGSLAYDNAILLTEVRLGVMVGSILSAVIAYAILRKTASAP